MSNPSSNPNSLPRSSSPNPRGVSEDEAYVAAIIDRLGAAVEAYTRAHPDFDESQISAYALRIGEAAAADMGFFGDDGPLPRLDWPGIPEPIADPEMPSSSVGPLVVRSSSQPDLMPGEAPVWYQQFAAEHAAASSSPAHQAQSGNPNPEPSTAPSLNAETQPALDAHSVSAPELIDPASVAHLKPTSTKAE